MTPLSRSADDSAWPPITSGNHLVREGDVIVKQFGARLGAFAREGELLSRLSALDDPLPVPRLVPARLFGELRYAYIDGVTASEAIAGGLAPQVLSAMGAFLSRLHLLDPGPLADLLPGDGPVVAHGDFSPSNVIVDAASGCLRAVLDWEEARLDTAALDLAWCEAQVLHRFPHLRGTLRHLYAGYGEAPDPAARARALEQRSADLHACALAARASAAEATTLHRCGFRDAEEASAFVAALSRALASPAGARYRRPEAEPLVWASEDGRDVYLTAAALRATAECFGVPHTQPVELKDAPPSCQLLYGAGAMPAWGTDAARRHLTNRCT